MRASSSARAMTVIPPASVVVERGYVGPSVVDRPDQKRNATISTAHPAPGSPRRASWRARPGDRIPDRTPESLVRDPTIVTSRAGDRDPRSALTGPVGGPTVAGSGT